VVRRRTLPTQCGKCGTLNETLGSSRTFGCGLCDAKGDRDVHTARNILLRFLKAHTAKEAARHASILHQRTSRPPCTSCISEADWMFENWILGGLNADDAALDHPFNVS
jgi:hypothetical protein